MLHTINTTPPWTTPTTPRRASSIKIPPLTTRQQTIPTTEFFGAHSWGTRQISRGTRELSRNTHIRSLRPANPTIPYTLSENLTQDSPSRHVTTNPGTHVSKVEAHDSTAEEVDRASRDLPLSHTEVSATPSYSMLSSTVSRCSNRQNTQPLSPPACQQ